MFPFKIVSRIYFKILIEIGKIAIAILNFLISFYSFKRISSNDKPIPTIV